MDHCGWATSDSSRGGLWRLLAGQSYYVLTEAEGPTVPSGTSTLTAGPGLVIDGPAKLERGRLSQRGVTGGKIDYKAAPSQGYPLPTFRYAFADTSLGGGIVLAPADPLLEPSWPEGGKGKSFVPKSHRAGTRFAFLAGQGKLRQTFKLTEAGEYAVVFTANSSLNEWKSREGENPFTIRLDDVLVWDSAVGESRKPKGGLFQWGTLYTQLEAGSHTLTIESRSRNPKDVVYFYALHLGSINDFVGGPTAANFLGAGAATGQTDGRFAMIAELCTAMAQNWGLVAYAYEGGTNAGGDWGGGKLDYAHQFKWKHPLSKVADNQWARFWHNYGGANAFYYYPGFEYKNIHRAFEYMPWAAATERAHTWVYEPQGPPAAPLVLTPATRHYQSSRGSQWEKWYHPFVSDQLYAEVTAKLGTEGQWKGFVFRAPRPGKYRLVATTQGEGGLKLIVNDSQAISSGPAGLPVSITVTLTQGIHAVRVQNTTGNFELQSLEITPSP